MAVKKVEKDNVAVLIDNVWFYLFFFICLIMIASFGLIAEA